MQMAFLSISLAASLAVSPAAAVDPSRAAAESAAPSAPMSKASRARVIGGGMTDADYPDSARAAEEEGRVYISYLVTLDGKARDCHVQQSSGSLALDARTCEIVNTRYLMEPPRDEADNPVSKRVWQFIDWRLAL